MNDSPDLPSTIHAEQTHLRLPSQPHWIEPTVEYLRQKAILAGACHETRSGKLLLALQEALTNALVHGNYGIPSELKERDDDAFARALAERAADPELSTLPVDVVVDYDGRRCRWIITDQGPGFDVAKVLGRLESDEPDVLLASGRGILIMRSFLDDVRYEEGGRRVILTLQRESGEEKRQQPRLDTNQPVRVAPIRADGSVDWEAAYEAVSLNLSQQGMGLLQQQLHPADRILIGIYAGTRPIYIPAEVRHFRHLGDDVVELGCRFQTRTEVAAKTSASLDARQDFPQQDPEQAVSRAVEHLLSNRQQPPAGRDERRAHPRMNFNERIEILEEGKPQPIVAYARDLSHGGIAFITTVALPPDVVSVILPADRGPPLRLRSRIVRCNRIQEGFYDVGAMFLKVE